MVLVAPISVVIPTYNRADDLIRAVDSVARQTVPVQEIIISDDGSTDHTRQVIDTYSSEIELIYLWQSNSGRPAVARNRAIERATGAYIAFLDSDDWWFPIKVERMLTHGLLDVDVAYHELEKVPATSRLRHGRRARSRQVRTPVKNDLLHRGNVIPNSSAIVRTAILRQVQGLDESWDRRSWEDFDLWLRVSEVTDRFRFVDQVLGGYSTGEGLTNPEQILLNIDNFVATWLPSESEPSWVRQQRAIALAALGRHDEAKREARSALRHPSTLRFGFDFVLGAGLAARETLQSVMSRGQGSARSH